MSVATGVIATGIAAVFIGAIGLTVENGWVHPITSAIEATTGAYTPVEWERGYKTDRVVATRYQNKMMGYNIGFTFPRNPNDCDRAELSEFMEMHGGGVYQSGGSPGAEMFVSFTDVKNKDTANAKIKEILPALSRLIVDLGNGAKVEIPGFKEKEAAEKVSYETAREERVAKAKSLVSFVKDAQSANLEKYQAALDADKATWAFEAVRKGDYLSVTITRGQYDWKTGSIKPQISVLAIRLMDAPQIVLNNGSAPSLTGKDEFYESDIHYKDDAKWTTEIRFDGVSLPGTDQKEADGWSGRSSMNGQISGGLGVYVDGIAQAAKDDVIVFGEGGGSEWNDMLSSSRSVTWQTSDEPRMKQQRPGTTLRMPYGLGQQVYRQIMDAIAIKDRTELSPSARY